MMTPGRLWWLFNRDRRRGIRGAWHYHVTLPKILNVVLPAPGAGPSAEVHLVTGEEYWKLGLWMAASFFHATGRSWPIVIHDDGTCGKDTIAGMRRVIPFARFISRVEADTEIESRLRDFNHIRTLRASYSLLMKLTDTQLLSSASKRLILDCDMLFFRKPSEVLNWAEEPSPPNLFLTDVTDASAVPPEQIQHQLGITLLANMNSGLCALRDGFLDLERIEEALEKTELLRAKRRWTVEQTLFAILAGLQLSRLLPKSYVVSVDRHSPKSAVMRHYIGRVRNQFYSEGLGIVAPTLIHEFSA